ncbi:transporter, putative fucose permease, partial [human gut metagenome]
DKNMIRLGIVIIVAGIVMLFMPIPGAAIALAGLIIIGLGCAPIYPSIIHSTPFNFGADNSQAVIGIQMAFAYVGTTFMPPLFGLIAQYINIGLFPVYILIFTAIMLLTTEVLNNINKDKAYK